MGGRRGNGTIVAPSQQPRPARKAGFSTFENDCGRETDSLLEGDGFDAT
jgi:hypothetical protein